MLYGADGKPIKKDIFPKEFLDRMAELDRESRRDEIFFNILIAAVAFAGALVIVLCIW